MEINPTSVKRPFHNSYVILPSELSAGFPPAFSKEMSLQFEREEKKTVKKRNKKLRVCSFWIILHWLYKNTCFLSNL